MALGKSQISDLGPENLTITDNVLKAVRLERRQLVVCKGVFVSHVDKSLATTINSGIQLHHNVNAQQKHMTQQLNANHALLPPVCAAHRPNVYYAKVATLHQLVYASAQITFF